MRLHHRITVALPALVLLAVFCSDQDTAGPASETGEGMCIYRAEVTVGGDLSYQQFDPDTVTLSATPAIAYEDIVAYDTVAHVVTLARCCRRCLAMARSSSSTPSPPN
jgi:hypothetical protein